jgi:hypothetical protein
MRGGAVLDLLNEPTALFFVMLASLLVLLHIGYRVGRLRSAEASEEEHAQVVAARDGTGLLLSLLLGFTLAMALPNYELRKRLVIDEANAIGTTNLRAQILPEPARSKLLGLLREYVQARTDYKRAGLGGEELRASFERAKELQDAMWQQSVTIAQQNNTPMTSLFLQALNDSIDLSEKRLAALEARIPLAIWLMLGFVSLLTCFLTGYSMRRRFVLVMLVSPLMISVVLALIADLDSPRSGLIRVQQQSMERLHRDLETAPSK